VTTISRRLVRTSFTWYFQFLTDLEQRLRRLGVQERESLQLEAEELKDKGAREGVLPGISGLSGYLGDLPKPARCALSRS
jgi:hypothetical protein